MYIYMIDQFLDIWMICTPVGSIIVKKNIDVYLKQIDIGIFWANDNSLFDIYFHLHIVVICSRNMIQS